MSRWDIEGYVAICKGQEGGFINAYMQTHTHTHTRAHTHTHIYIYICMYKYTYTCWHKRVYDSGCKLKVEDEFGIWGPGGLGFRASHRSGFRSELLQITPQGLGFRV